jgi:DNA polymerase I-like protein with 3'-5' exonuclease and polymerase domains
LHNIKGPYTKVSFERFNLNSHSQIKDYLLTQGWKPTQWNFNKKTKEKTSPKLTEDSFSSIKGEFGQLIARRNVLTHRRNTILNIKDPDNKGWINQVRGDGKIEASANPCGCNTGRYQHRVVVNVPKASEKVVYGKEMRSLFKVPRGYSMVGVDASALEARTEAHNCFSFQGGKRYAHELIEGDVHSANARLFGTDRDGAKSPKYALTYGGQIPRLQEILGCSKLKAAQLFNNFWRDNTALSGMKEAVTKAWQSRRAEKGGYVIGLDGRKLFARSSHSLVNLKFQSDGALIIKRAMKILWLEWLPKTDIEAYLLIQQHDEWQAQVREGQEKQYADLALRALVEAGRYYNYKVPIVGKAIVGRNWAQTH